MNLKHESAVQEEKARFSECETQKALSKMQSEKKARFSECETQKRFSRRETSELETPKALSMNFIEDDYSIVRSNQKRKLALVNVKRKSAFHDEAPEVVENINGLGG